MEALRLGEDPTIVKYTATYYKEHPEFKADQVEDKTKDA